MSSTSGPKKQSIFDRLTDPSQYTGAHKLRFDKDGKGLGKAGRDPGVDSQTHDLSQMTRTNLNSSASPSTVSHRASTGSLPTASKKPT